MSDAISADSGINDAFANILGSIRKEYESLPEGQELISNLTGKFQAIYDSPPLKSAKLICQNEGLSEDELRGMLFAPKESALSFYVTCLKKGSGEAEKEKLRSILLSIIYLAHRKNRVFLNWFVIHGGLPTLVALIVDSNLYHRGQAIEVLMTIIDCDDYDWFSRPKSNEDSNLHYHLANLHTTSPFLQAVVDNRENTYPGGSMRALQLLAFWLSWIRALYTPSQVLFLSEDLLQALNAWTVPNPPKREVATEEESKLARTLYDDFGTNQFGEVELLPTAPANNDGTYKGLYVAGIVNVPQITLTPPAAVNASISGPNPAAVEISLSQPPPGPAPDKAEIIDSEQLPPPPPTILKAVEAMKRKGNEVYARGDFAEAIRLYEEIIELFTTIKIDPSAAPPEVRLTELHASVHFNIAASHWREIQNLKKVLASDKSNENLRQNRELLVSLSAKCEQSCRKALSLQKSHAKAGYRLGVCLLEQGKAQEALQVVDEILAFTWENREERAPSSSVTGIGTNGSGLHHTKSGEKSNVDISALQTLRRECLAEAILRNSENNGNAISTGEIENPTAVNGAGGSSSTATQRLLGEKAAKMLAALQKRTERMRGKVSHAWDGWVPGDAISEERTESDVVADEIDEETALAAVPFQTTAESFESSQLSSKKSETLSTKKSKSSSKTSSGKTGSSSSKSGAKKTQTSGSIKLTATATQCVLSVKRAALAFEHWQEDNFSAASTFDYRAISIIVDELPNRLIVTALEEIAKLRAENATIAMAFAHNLEEPLLTLLLGASIQDLANRLGPATDASTTSVVDSADPSKSLAVQILSQLPLCDRFETLLSMTYHSNSTLCTQVTCVLKLLLATVSSLEIENDIRGLAERYCVRLV